MDKFKTEIDPESFVGSNSSLVAPVKLGKGAYVASGNVITKDVPDGSLGVGRARQKHNGLGQTILESESEMSRISSIDHWSAGFPKN